MEDGLVLLLICERGDKEHNEESGQQQQCLLASKGLDGSVKFNPALQKEMEKKEGSRRSMTTQRQGGATSTYVHQGHLREEMGQLCEMKEEIRKGCCWK